MTKKTEGKKKGGVWVLTSEVNDYDQHGAYFRAVFEQKPTLMELATFFEYDSQANEHYAPNMMSAVAFLEHLLSGGGRRDAEHEWYSLEFVEFGSRYRD